MQLVPIPGSAYESAVRTMTLDQLRSLGLRHVAYLKTSMCDGKQMVIIHGADGALVDTADILTAAIELITEHGLRVMTVH